MWLRRFVVLLICFVVAGCKAEMVTNIYFSDLLEEWGSETVTVASELWVEGSGIADSDEKCSEMNDKILPLLERYLDGVKPAKCSDGDGISDWATFKFDLPVRFVKNIIQEQNFDDIFVLAIEEAAMDAYFGDQMYQAIPYGYRANPKKVKALAADIYEETYQRLDVAEMKFHFRVSHDERVPRDYGVSFNWMGEDPCAGRCRKQLERRDTITLTLSDINAAALVKYGKGAGMWFILRDGETLPPPN